MAYQMQVSRVLQQQQMPPPGYLLYPPPDGDGAGGRAEGMAPIGMQPMGAPMGMQPMGMAPMGPATPRTAASIARERRRKPERGRVACRANGAKPFIRISKPASRARARADRRAPCASLTPERVQNFLQVALGLGVLLL